MTTQAHTCWFASIMLVACAGVGQAGVAGAMSASANMEYAPRHREWTSARSVFEATAVSQLSIRLTSPPVHGVIRGQERNTFEWVTEVPGGVPSRVRLELSPDGPDGPWAIIADDLPDVGRHEMIPPLYRQREAAYLRATVYAGGEAASDEVGPFLIRTWTPCYADCDTFSAVPALDIFDFLCFGLSFNRHEPYACNCDLSTGLNVCDIFDFLCFSNEYAARAHPCP